MKKVSYKSSPSLEIFPLLKETKYIFAYLYLYVYYSVDRHAPRQFVLFIKGIADSVNCQNLRTIIQMHNQSRVLSTNALSFLPSTHSDIRLEVGWGQDNKMPGRSNSLASDSNGLFNLKVHFRKVSSKLKAQISTEPSVMSQTGHLPLL